ncbi:hypothetical protein L484_009165 [Morus notabilis]|uniref:Uncharacterized protein n=1 Tax=Morus notabilis TaxID=981085 RepID=W9RYJ7_9ROSA|nr:hypothetical protein L484_009165 [Morus notabilis]
MRIKTRKYPIPNLVKDVKIRQSTETATARCNLDNESVTMTSASDRRPAVGITSIVADDWK